MKFAVVVKRYIPEQESEVVLLVDAVDALAAGVRIGQEIDTVTPDAVADFGDIAMAITWGNVYAVSGEVPGDR